MKNSQNRNIILNISICLFKERYEKSRQKNRVKYLKNATCESFRKYKEQS